MSRSGAAGLGAAVLIGALVACSPTSVAEPVAPATVQGPVADAGKRFAGPVCPVVLRPSLPGQEFR